MSNRTDYEPQEARGAINEAMQTKSNFADWNSHLSLVAQSVCKITYMVENESCSASGFLCRHKVRGSFCYGLITNNHVIGENHLITTKWFKFTMSFEASPRPKQYDIQIGRNTCSYYTDKDLDVTFLELEPEFQRTLHLDGFEFMSLSKDKCATPGQQILIFQYPGGGPPKFAYHQFISLSESGNFSHSVSTLPGSSGSPVLIRENKKFYSVIGIHKGAAKDGTHNIGVAISKVLESMSIADKWRNFGEKSDNRRDEFHRATQPIASKNQFKSNLPSKAASQQQNPKQEDLDSAYQKLGDMCQEVRKLEEITHFLTEMERNLKTNSLNLNWRDQRMSLPSDPIRGWKVSNGTFLHRAVQDFNPCMEEAVRIDIVKFLISKGLQVDAKQDFNGMTPLHMAASAFCDQLLETTKILIKNGANVNLSDGDGWTPLIYAAYSGNMATMCFLLESGANIDAKDKKGKTALHQAVCFNKTHIVRELKKRGASLQGLSEEMVAKIDNF